ITPMSMALTRRLIECVGPIFLNYWQVPGSKFETEVSDDPLSLQDDDEDEENTPGYIDPDDVHFLRSLDPKEWKDQDHYAVLGLRKLPWFVRNLEVRGSNRLKVLRHHPDKRRARVEEVHPDDDYFTCITRAYDILGNPRNRRSYDSVDPQFDNSLPVINEHSRNNFYEVFGKAFDLNSRWSEKMPVPKLGNESTPRGNVEKFYSFWYDFQSWREYSYLDEEEKDQAQGCHIQYYLRDASKNKIKRLEQSGRKREMARIRTLVDTAYNMDPRIQKFKQEDKDRKMAAKQAKKVAAARARDKKKKNGQESSRKALAAEEEMRKLKEEAEAEQRAKLEAMKAERETQKTCTEKGTCNTRKIAKENNYYAKDTSEVIDNMASLEKICECLRLDKICALPDILKERIPTAEATLNIRPSGDRKLNGKNKKGSLLGTMIKLQLLIKAVNVFPAGTNQR
ncbi:hypothetical protein L9F63_027818, partial [Diploptera punctata]